VNEVAITDADELSKRALVIAATLALVADAVVTTQVRPALVRRAMRLAIPLVLTRPVAGILTRLGI
jgi:hypothetical protein